MGKTEDGLSWGCKRNGTELYLAILSSTLVVYKHMTRLMDISGLDEQEVASYINRFKDIGSELDYKRIQARYDLYRCLLETANKVVG